MTRSRTETGSYQRRRSTSRWGITPRVSLRKVTTGGSGLADLAVLESERLGARAWSMSQYLLRRLQDVLAGYEMR